MVEDNIDNDATYFLDTDVNSFKDEIIVLVTEKTIPSIAQEVVRNV